MQARKFLLLIFTLFGGVALLTSCTAPLEVKTQSVLKTPIVELHVAGNPKKLHITTSSNTKCKPAQSTDPNCIDVPQLDRALITFELTPNAGWRFSEFRICVGATKATQVCELDIYQQREFVASVKGGSTHVYPDEHGVINLKPLSPDLTKKFTAFQLLDHNWVESFYFYGIKVCPTGDPEVEADCVWTDPPILNGGMGTGGIN